MAIDGVTSCMKIREVNKNKKQFVELRKSELTELFERGILLVRRARRWN